MTLYMMFNKPTKDVVCGYIIQASARLLCLRVLDSRLGNEAVIH